MTAIRTAKGPEERLMNRFKSVATRLAARRRSALRGFSLIELVIVVVIIGIIAAIAIPRMSRGSEGAAESALSGNLSVLRSAIDLYYTEHGIYPEVAKFETQMRQYTDVSGNPQAAKD